MRDEERIQIRHRAAACQKAAAALAALAPRVADHLGEPSDDRALGLRRRGRGAPRGDVQVEAGCEPRCERAHRGDGRGDVAEHARVAVETAVRDDVAIALDAFERDAFFGQRPAEDFAYGARRSFGEDRRPSGGQRGDARR